jgi:NADH dehydrogenase (ubiquinone) Fe-S protein 1
MRIQPRTNDDVNEEWISDKTRHAQDGLRFQRLTVPLLRQGDRFVPVSWEEALGAVKEGLASTGAKDNEIQAVAGHLADTESLVALKDLMNRLGSDNLTSDQDRGNATPVHGVDIRSNYLFNSTIPALEQTDAILLIGTNPRHEAAVMNSRIRKNWLHSTLEVGLIGEPVDLMYEYTYLGTDGKALADIQAGKSEFAKKFKNAKKPLIVVGSAVAEHPDGAAIYQGVAKLVQSMKSSLLTPEWNGFNVLQRVCTDFFIGVWFSPLHCDLGCLPYCHLRHRLRTIQGRFKDNSQVHLPIERRRDQTSVHPIQCFCRLSGPPW